MVEILHFMEEKKLGYVFYLVSYSFYLYTQAMIISKFVVEQDNANIDIF